LHLMTNTALTGATYDIDGGQQIVHLDGQELRVAARRGLVHRPA
jgi:hypothetical protein